MAAGARASSPAPHWGPAGFAPSPLEREFLAVAASQPNLGQEST
jgi:hypothetical protein